MPWVYVLACSDGSYYVGLAQVDIDRRSAEHQNGTYPGYTSVRRPVELVWSAEYTRFDDAIALERKLKGWSRAKKEAFMRGDYDGLKHLSGRRGGRTKT